MSNRRRRDNNVEEILGLYNCHFGTPHDITDPGMNYHLKRLDEWLMGNMKNCSGTPFWISLACKEGKITLQ